MFERVRQIHGSAVIPEWVTVTLVKGVVEYDKVSNMLRFRAHRAVVFVDCAGLNTGIWEHQQQPHDTVLYKVNARRFQWLNEATRETNGNTVFVPILLALPGHKLDRARVGERFIWNVGEKQVTSRLLIHKVITVNETVTGAVLQRYPPLPAHLVCYRTGVGLWMLIQFALNSPSPIGRKPVTPIIKPCLKRTLTQ